MTKALLVGNGVTSYLIKEYSNLEMLRKLHNTNPNIYNSIDDKFNIFRKLPLNKMRDEANKQIIIDCIKKNNIFDKTSAENAYDRFFEIYGLKYELFQSALSGIETLLKVVKLFDMPIELELMNMSKDLYYNEGCNGFDDIEIEIDKNMFKDYINTFSDVFTTNYDYLLDDVFTHTVYHLHGGFSYEKIREDCGAIDIICHEERNCVDDPFLAWGIDGEEKYDKVKGGITFPISFPIHFPLTIIQQYLDGLENSNYSELHIWGYSGQNDKHINDRIKRNKYIKKIYYYCDPILQIDDVQFRDQINNMFLSQENTVVLKSWNLIWETAGVQI